jgi:hypothetical protein
MIFFHYIRGLKYVFGKIVSFCSFAMSGQLFAAADVGEAIRSWEEMKAAYEEAYVANSRFSEMPIDTTYIPEGAMAKGTYKGFFRYQLPGSSAYVFRAVSAKQRKDLISKLDFLYNLIDGHKNEFFPEQDPGTFGISVKFITSYTCFSNIFNRLIRISETLGSEGSVYESDITLLYLILDITLGELTEKSEEEKRFVELLYKPIKDWIISSLQASPLIAYLSPDQEGRGIRVFKISMLDRSVNLDVNIPLKFRGVKYINGYFGVAPKFNEIAKWLDNPKFASDEVNQLKRTAELELQMFEERLKGRYVVLVK